MNDGRLYSSWQLSGVVNDNIRRVENIHTNWDYRRFMTNNGLQIMKSNNQEACLSLGLPTHFPTSSNPANNVLMYSILIMIIFLQDMDVL
jgi:hypothetical protein